MAEIGFYHLTVSPLEAALPRLLERILKAGQRAVLRAASAERLEALDRLLWTYDKAAFLPHGGRSDGYSERQPIWLTTGFDRPNEASVLVLVEGAALGELAVYGRVCDLFDGNDEAAVRVARERWRECRAQGHRLVYWQQSAQGGWQAAQQAGGPDPADGEGERSPPSAAPDGSL